MNINIPGAILTSTLVNLSFTPARPTSRAGKDKRMGHIGARFAFPRAAIPPPVGAEAAVSGASGD